MLILIGAVPERLVHGDQSRSLLPSSLALPGPAVGFSTATLIQGREEVCKLKQFITGFALEESTKRTLKSQIRAYELFCRYYDIPAFSVLPHVFHAYIAFLGKSLRSYLSLKNDLSSLQNPIKNLN